MLRFAILIIFICCISYTTTSHAQSDDRYYDMSYLTLIDLWIDPINGSDSNDGTTSTTALQTVDAAWNRIPMGETLSDAGYYLHLLPGNYPAENLPNFWESRYGTSEFPILIESVQGASSVTLSSINLYDSRYVYFVNLTINANADAFHCEKCDHILIKGSTLIGADPETYNAQETIKINQSQHIYLENNDISGAWDNAIDFVAVQYGHWQGNHIHNAGDWCGYLKGGSAYFRVESNIFDDCGTGGFTAGQGTGFQFMSAPWIHYEAYFIQFINNIVHDTDGAGVGVQGGYNIIIAYNTFYRVGARSHLLEVVFGNRSCDGQLGDTGRERCQEYLEMGGWGTTVVDDGSNSVRIPNKHIYIYNNIFYNPADYRSEYQHFTIFAPFAPQPTGNLPNAVLADDDLQIQANVIWNGAPDHALGIEDNAGCTGTNSTCNQAQLYSQNAINTLEPQFADPEKGDFRPQAGSSLTTVIPVPIPVFEDNDLPALLPPVEISTVVNRDFMGTTRNLPIIGAFGSTQ